MQEETFFPTQKGKKNEAMASISEVLGTGLHTHGEKGT